MSDLIDLNSPDTNKVLKKELASPLIPPPVGIEKDDQISVINNLPNLTGEKINSLENNPFDQVLHETTEYVRKKEDPFEMVLAKVVNSKKSELCQSIEFKDGFTPKNRNHEVLKLNKTLDISIADNDSNISNSGCEINRISENLNNSGLLRRNNYVKNVPHIFIQPDSPLNSSILNYSAMNDSLTEASINIKEPVIQSLLKKRAVLCAEKGIMEKEGILNDNQQVSLLDTRRCHSLSDRLSPKRFNCKQRLDSTGHKKIFNKSERSTLSSVSSIEFEDEMNKAFFQEQSNLDNSVFLDLSNVSEITRLNSLSSASLSFLSNGTMNQAFLRSHSSSSNPYNASPAINYYPRNTQNSCRSNSSSTIDSISTAETVKDDLSTLRQKFENLKMKLSYSANNLVDDKKDFPEIAEKNKELKSNAIEDFCKMQLSGIENKIEIDKKIDKKEEKLIDVEVFIPSDDSKSSKSKESFTDSSSDSVFTKSITDKSILNEAKKLAKTFEEMADDMSNSSGFDLLSNYTQFDFDHLPDSDDEAVDNLIDLPSSPMKSDVPPNSPTETENENSECNEIQKEMKKIKEIEKEFTQPEDAEKKIIVTSLLLQVEQLIKNENPDAEKLLNELEKVLGLKCKNNTDLLKIYLESTKSSIENEKDVTENRETEDESVESKSVENKDDFNVNDTKLEKNASDKVSVKEGLKRKSSYVIRKGKTDIIKSFSKSFDSSPKVKSSVRKSNSIDMSVSQVDVRNYSQFSKDQRKSQILETRKRFSSDPNDLNSSLNKKQTFSTLSSLKKTVSTKVQEKIVSVPEIHKGTFSHVSNSMRNKLKTKPETGISKKGPMKATVPFGNLQRRDSVGKKVPSVSQVETPSKSSLSSSSTFNVPTSTPNASISSLFKTKSKPVASSTPDNKDQKTVMKPKSPRTRKLLCNISPVSTLMRSTLEKLSSKGSPKEKKINETPPRKASTPKARKPPRTPSGIPKMSPKPVLQRRKSLNDLNKSVQCSEYSQPPTCSNLQKSLGSAKKVTSLIPQSPLRNRNKTDSKFTPVDLTSKMHRRGDEYIEAEKENFS